MKPAKRAKTAKPKSTGGGKLVTLPVRWTVSGTTLKTSPADCDLYDLSLKLDVSLYQRAY